MAGEQALSSEKRKKDKPDFPHLLAVILTTEGSVGNVYNRFGTGDYSLLNQAMLREQGVDEPIGTKKRWLAIGRTLLRHARPKAIWVPKIVQVDKRLEEATEDLDATRERVARLIGFKLIHCIYGYSETEGAEPEPINVPGWDTEQMLANLVITRVPFRELNTNVQGYAEGRTIAINPVAVHPLRTTIHETAHVVLGDTERKSDLAEQRPIMEFRAEAVAHLVLNALDMMTDELRIHGAGYMHSWLSRAGRQPTAEEVKPIFSAADLILHAGRVPVEEAVPLPVLP